jgi:hypothetical protein
MSSKPYESAASEKTWGEQMGYEFPESIAHDPVSHEMVAGIYAVTPDTARRWLARNRRNRLLSKKRAAAYAEDMRVGHWHENGESIKFDTEGVLCDGQHRLQAIVNNGVSRKCVVVLGVRGEARATIDIGSKRTSAQNLGIDGVKHPGTVAPAIQLWAAYYESRLSLADLDHPGGIDTALSHIEARQWLDRFPTMERSAVVAKKLSKEATGICLLTPSETAFTHFAVSYYHGDETAMEFVESILTGSNIVAGSIILALRNRLIDDIRYSSATPNRTRRGRLMKKGYRIALILKAFKLWRRGVTRKVLTVGEKESFPRIEV